MESNKNVHASFMKKKLNLHGALERNKRAWCMEEGWVDVNKPRKRARGGYVQKFGEKSFSFWVKTLFFYIKK